MPDFNSTDYLQQGTPRQQLAYRELRQHRLFDILKPFNPVLTGTIPINIDIDTSDLDVICCFTDVELFKTTVTEAFGALPGFELRTVQFRGITTIVANFRFDHFPVEVFGQPIPVQKQYAYRHMLIEHTLLTQRDETFRLQIIDLKRKGYKTEPAFAHILGLTGDPYEALLQFEEQTKP